MLISAAGLMRTEGVDVDVLLVEDRPVARNSCDPWAAELGVRSDGRRAL
jgi:hypothetical protein